MQATNKVVLETSMGNLTIELYGNEAPITVKNFLSYVESNFYEGTIFHRVIKNFMIQGGGMDKDMKEKKSNAPIKNEADNGLKNDYGTLAMARTMVVDSATNQFFINVKDNDFLNFRSKTSNGWGYAVFGKVIDGMDIVDKIALVKTGNHGHHQDVPLEVITINKCYTV